MTRSSKRKVRVKEQEWNNNRTFAKKLWIDNDDDWGNDDDSSWNEDDSNWNEVFLPNKEKNCELVWSDSAHLEQKNANLTLLEKPKNQHILINMDQVVLLQKLQKEQQK